MEHIKHDSAVATAPVAIVLPKELSGGRQRPVTKPATNGRLGAARAAVREFLRNEFKAREVRVTKIGPAAGDPQGWYVEAEILVPDLGIKTLGLPLTQEVLARELCALDLDGEMTVKSYEVLDPRDR